MMENILINDTMNEPRYVFKNTYIDDDTDEWTAEEFYGSECEGEYFTESFLDVISNWAGRHPNNPIVRLAIRIYRNKDRLSRALQGTLKELPEFENDDDLEDSVVLRVWNQELSANLEAIEFFQRFRTRNAILMGIIAALRVVKYVTEEVKFKSSFGRFPADICKFYMFLTELPKTLTEADIKKLKNELKILRKDTRWLTGRHGLSISTPKERKTLELIDDQVHDLLSFGMIDKRGSKINDNRIRDRLEQLIDTSNEFLKMIHADLIKANKAETVKEYMI